MTMRKRLRRPTSPRPRPSRHRRDPRLDDDDDDREILDGAPADPKDEGK
jgi:hypothetical protein